MVSSNLSDPDFATWCKSSHRLIETYFPSDKAREALNNLANERVQIPSVRRFGNTSDAAGGLSEETVKASINTIAMRADPAAASAVQLLDKLKGSPTPSLARETKGEVDRGRKIRAEMRRWLMVDTAKRRRSINGSHYFTSYDHDEDENPSRLSSGSTNVSTASSEATNASKISEIDVSGAIVSGSVVKVRLSRNGIRFGRWN